GSNFKPAAPLIIEQGSEYCRGIEIRIAQKIDRAVHAHERDGLHVPDHSVIFNWFKGHVMIRYGCVLEADQTLALHLSVKVQRHKGLIGSKGRAKIHSRTSRQPSKCWTSWRSSTSRQVSPCSFSSGSTRAYGVAAGVHSTVVRRGNLTGWRETSERN